MIIIQVMGGLGNQLQQYAFVDSYKKEREIHSRRNTRRF